MFNHSDLTRLKKYSLKSSTNYAESAAKRQPTSFRILWFTVSVSQSV